VKGELEKGKKVRKPRGMEWEGGSGVEGEQAGGGSVVGRRGECKRVGSGGGGKKGVEECE